MLSEREDGRRPKFQIFKPTSANWKQTLRRYRNATPSQKILTDITQANKNHLQDLQTAHDEYTATKTEQAARLQRAEEKAQEAEERSGTSAEKASNAEIALAEKEKEKAAVQGELDDLLMVFGDLEDKVARYKERLKGLGESISDDEDDDEEDEEEDEVD